MAGEDQERRIAGGSLEFAQRLLDPDEEYAILFFPQRINIELSHSGSADYEPPMATCMNLGLLGGLDASCFIG